MKLKTGIGSYLVSPKQQNSCVNWSPEPRQTTSFVTANQSLKKHVSHLCHFNQLQKLILMNRGIIHHQHRLVESSILLLLLVYLHISFGQCNHLRKGFRNMQILHLIPVNMNFQMHHPTICSITSYHSEK